MNNEHKRYSYEGNLPVVVKLLQQPTVASLNEETLKRVYGIQKFAEGTGFLTFKQMQALGAIWKYSVNNDEYIHWDWWPKSGNTHPLLED